jgi:uncharacterized protein YndB with AHSA1/START domain
VPEKGNDLNITRVFDAPRELVFKAWTEPERIKQWLAPRGFTIPFADGELRPGGKWRQSMVKPDGTELWLGGEYREIVEPERLVFTHAWDDANGKPGPETTITVTFTERDGKTEMKFRQGPFVSDGERQGHSGGWTECFDKLDELLANEHAGAASGNRS